MLRQLNLDMMTEITVIASLLHDIGKSNNAFQERLLLNKKGGDYYRHEWLSLKMFIAMIDGCSTDAEWLVRFSALPSSDGNCLIDSVSSVMADNASNPDFDASEISILPPLAQWVAWLIVTHHRLPPSVGTQQGNLKAKKDKLLRSYDTNSGSSYADISNLYELMHAFDGWQKNPIVAIKDPCRASQSLVFNRLVINSEPWRYKLSEFSRKALNNKLLFPNTGKPLLLEPLDCNYTLYMSRLLLILSDHNYSSLADDDLRRIDICTDFRDMFANSNKSDGSVRQSLDEHLMGVGAFTDSLSKNLPDTLSRLPRLLNHEPLSNNTDNKRFDWQNKAYASASAIRDHSEVHGFFGVNLASTGTGKTIGNARIMYALANPDFGARFTVALGLRVLTLQTGQQFRSKLSLSDSEVAVVVGGTASTDLYEMNNPSATAASDASLETPETSQIGGSESLASIYPHNVDSVIADLHGLDTILGNDKARKMLLAPILSCTIDHLIHASESLRGGSHIPAALRLLSSDLILDEPDDFGIDDMYALSRLVFTAGMLGSRVLLSSATLPPSMVAFLFDAYASGRERYNHANSLPTGDNLKVATLFFDEQAVNPIPFFTSKHHQLATYYSQFIGSRLGHLDAMPVRRTAKIIDVGADYDRDFPEVFYESVAQTVVDAAFDLHNTYHDNDGEKRVSVGLVRMTYTKSIVAIAQQLASTTIIPNDTHIHICCYHSRQVLALRSGLESMLDSILDRSTEGGSLFDSHHITDAMERSDARNHIFLVLATPISEVGRDHDYDWAVIEPSSIRSIVQLAGRVWRHRPNKPCDSPNMAILRYNLRYFTRGNNPYSDQNVFIHSGFESDDNKIVGYDVSKLIDQEILSKIDSRGRISEPPHTMVANSLVELEHNMMRKVLNVDGNCLANAIWHKKTTMYAACTDIQVLTPFREQLEKSIDYAVYDTGRELNFYHLGDLISDDFANIDTQNHVIEYKRFESNNSNTSLWLSLNIEDELAALSIKKPSMSITDIVKSYFTVNLRDARFSYNEFLGFYYE